MASDYCVETNNELERVGEEVGMALLRYCTTIYLDELKKITKGP